MAGSTRIIGYGICGPGEAARFMSETLDEFRRLCDDTIICINGPDGSVQPEIELVESYGFRYVRDRNEWGKLQWKIKHNFVDKHVRRLVKTGDVMVCLDMDERFDHYMTSDWLRAMPFDAYKVFIVDLWNDPEHYKPASCFWNTRIWRWTGNIEWWAKPLHCGLAPKWAVAYNRYAPFLLMHKGLMLKEDRARKIERYEKYDPHAKYLAKPFYAMLHSDTAEVFDEESMHDTISKEVETYKQTAPRALPLMATPKGRFAYVQNPGGMTIDIPEKQLAETLRRGGFVFLGWADEAEAEMEQLFSEDDDELEDPEAGDKESGGNYQRPLEDEKEELDGLNARDAEALAPGEVAAVPVGTGGPRENCRACKDLPEGETVAGHDHREVVEGDLAQNNRLGMKEAEKIRKGQKAAGGRPVAAKKAVKKAAKKAGK